MDRLCYFLLGVRVDDSSPPPRLLRIRSSREFILGTICIAVFTDIFLYGIVIPVIPFAISTRAGVQEADVQYWVSVLLAVYGGALLVGSPIAGWYADNSSSRRLPFVIGLLALAGATLLLCLARNVGLLVTGRLLQGLSAAIVWTVGEALLVDTVGEKDIGQLMGYVGISMSIGFFIAPLLGGVVYNQAGYFAVFYMCFALVFLDILLRLFLIEKKIAIQWIEQSPQTGSAPEDAASPASVTSGPDATISEEGHGVTAHREKSHDSAQQAVQPAAAKRRRKYPPVFILLSSHRLLAALWGCMVQATSSAAFDSVIPLFVYKVFNWDSTASGLVFMALIIPTFFGPLVGALSDHYGPRWLTVAGFLLAAPFWVLLRLVTQDTIGQKVLFCALLALIGSCLTLVMSPLMAEITYCVEAMEKKQPGIFGKTGAYAQAYGLFVTSFAAGTLIGPLWGGLVESKAGWPTMTWTLALFSAAGALTSFIWTGGLITKRNAKSGDERAIGIGRLTEQLGSTEESGAAV
jgi:MFS family permease